MNLIADLLIESQQDWTVARSDIFDASLDENTRVFPDLPAKLMKFLEVKGDNPLMRRYGKHDGPMTGKLKGFYHCHLRDDAVLIYKLERRTIFLVCIVAHADIEGKRLGMTSRRLEIYNPRS